MTVLILGGTAEARDIARRLHEEAADFMSSLAGRVARPRLPVGQVRVGGFGGVAGLAEFLLRFPISAVVDATHPFSEGMSRNALAACDQTRTPLLRLERPGWAGAPGSQTWHWVDSHDAAAKCANLVGSRPFLTVGRQSLAQFLQPLAERDVLARVVDRPDIELPRAWRVITSRGPYELDAERDIMRSHQADVLVTKDSGGNYTWAKMQAAAELGLRVVVVRRAPPTQNALVVHDVELAAAWARRWR